ncbi:MAG: ABC transporter ATP-binding protein, partial [Fibrobacter sp.]|nr:ABC transporter ATP-binding protein [Fibrobacter sp.]
MEKVLKQYLRPYYRRMAVGFIIKFIGCIMDLFLPWILAYMIDTIIPQRDKMMIYRWGMLMLVCSIFAITFNIIANRMASKVAMDATWHIRNDLFEKVMYLSSKSVDEYTKPSLIARLTSDTYNVHQAIGRMQRLGVRAPILLLGGIAVTMTLDPALSCVLIATLPILAWIMFSISKVSIPIYNKLQEAVDKFVMIVREDISGIRVIKALSKEQDECARFDKINKNVIGYEKHSGMVMAAIDPTVNLIMNMALVGVLIVGAVRVERGLTQVGKILAFMTYFTIILNAMISISKMFVIMSKAVASADRITMILDTSSDLKTIVEKELRDEDYHLVFDHVSFSYHEEKHKGQEAAMHLSDISFKLKRGETIGILGGTGAGKSTMINLMLRFYDVSKGRILLDGKDIRALPIEGLRQQFGVTFQNDMIFEDTILENVRLGRALTNEQVQQALLYAKAKEFVDEKKGSISEALAVKGANLSGGQKQRILIARALADHPPILILDDASSALDYKTDALLRQALREHFQGTTKIIVAQRISSIMHADHIIVLEDGRMIGSGTHEELMESCKAYQQISAS